MVRVCVALAIVSFWFGASGLIFGSGRAAASTPDLSSVVLTQTLPGLVADPPGPTNGPITRSNAAVLSGSLRSGSTGDDTRAVLGQLANGDLSGYLRTWSRQVPRNGDAAVILALSLKDNTDVGNFLYRLNNGMSPAATSVFSMPELAGAIGYTQNQPLSGHQLRSMRLLSPGATLSSKWSWRP